MSLGLLIGQLDKRRSPWVSTKMGMAISGFELTLLFLMAPLTYSLACYSAVHDFFGLLSAIYLMAIGLVSYSPCMA